MEWPLIIGGKQSNQPFWFQGIDGNWVQESSTKLDGGKHKPVLNWRGFFFFFFVECTNLTSFGMISLNEERVWAQLSAEISAESIHRWFLRYPNSPLMIRGNALVLFGSTNVGLVARYSTTSCDTRHWDQVGPVLAKSLPDCGPKRLFFWDFESGLGPDWP